eukprot:CAMPEP_0178386538 /NCGR_PEP_ID=MMETSP0689_2-20121128/8614_1 /TAXON_ID=160604 /ORGANISM="Amphidinium massartii, Strain CS-259" /LENGTH=267 /DNA_ID=CAMNT_0020006883 /DNA_START=154 /DNA_END=957 /DNA_ORIENTATION=-
MGGCRTVLPEKMMRNISITVPHVPLAVVQNTSLFLQVDTEGCARFLILTMQRSGSTAVMNRLDKEKQISIGYEGFNLHSRTQWGGQEMDRRGLDQETIQKMGPLAWANILFDKLEQKQREKQSNSAVGANQSCAVGFKLMGPRVDFCSNVSDLLRKTEIKKIILERTDTYSQWYSKQRGCWTEDYDSHVGKFANTSKAQQSLAVVQKALQEGKVCGGPEMAYIPYSTRKNALYSHWRQELQGQTYLETRTEHLDDEITAIRNFVLKK